MAGGLGDIRGRAARVVFGGLAAQLGLGCVYLASPLSPAMLAEFGWSRAELMAAGSPRTIVIALASPLVGVLTARFGARPVIAVSIALIGVVFAGNASEARVCEAGDVIDDARARSETSFGHLGARRVDGDHSPEGNSVLHRWLGSADLLLGADGFSARPS